MDLHAFSNYSGFIGIFVGVWLSLYLYKRRLEAKAPCCYYKTYQDILKSSPDSNPKIKIFYNTESVERVFTTYLWFWNAGGKPVTKSDIPSQSSVKLNFLDKSYPLRLLDYQVIKMTRDAINFRVSKDTDSSLIVQFDFLDYKDGALIEIQHTGSEDSEVKVEGIIGGVPKGVRVTRNLIKPFKLGNLRMGSPEKEGKLRRLRNLGLQVRLFITIFCLAPIVMTIYLSSHLDTSRSTVTKEELREWLLVHNPKMTEERLWFLLDETIGNSSHYSILTYVLTTINMAAMTVILVTIWLPDTSIPRRLNL